MLSIGATADRKVNANCKLQSRAEYPRLAATRSSGAAERAQRERSGWVAAARARLCFEFGFDDEIRLASLPRKVRTLRERAFIAGPLPTASPKPKRGRQLGKRPVKNAADYKSGCQRSIAVAGGSMNRNSLPDRQLQIRASTYWFSEYSSTLRPMRAASCWV